MNAQQWTAWRTPLWFFQVYLGFSVWLFFFGPWPWEVENGGQLGAFLMAAQVAVLVGYLAARPWVQARQAPPLPERIDAGLRFTRVAIVLSWLMAVPTSLARSGDWLPDVLGGLANAGLAYNENVERLTTNNAFVAFEYVRMLIAPWLLGVLPLTLVYFPKLSTAWRLAGLGSIAFSLAIYLSIGVNKGIADLVITLPWLLLLSAHSGLLQVRNLGWKLSLGSLALLTLFFAFFSAGQQSREGSGTEYGSFFTGSQVLLAKSDHFISSLLPDALRLVFEAVSRYVVQGYYALSLALQTDTPSTWGFGHSMFLARNADLISGGSFFVQQSIPGVLERDFGWPMFMLWHSIYPWLASDLGFGGTLLAMAGFGFLLGLAWGRALQLASPLWVVLLFLLLLLFYYVPANNQIFQSGESLAAFTLLLVALAWRGLATRAPAAAAEGALP